jgi:hypothetical protein
MALEKVVKVDLIEVLENGCIQVRTKTAIMEDGQQIGGSFHRHVISPGDDYAGEDARVQGICATMHTPAVVEEYKAAIEAAKAQQGE